MELDEYREVLRRDLGVDPVTGEEVGWPADRDALECLVGRRVALGHGAGYREGVIRRFGCDYLPCTNEVCVAVEWHVGGMIVRGHPGGPTQHAMSELTLLPTS